jgi:hypothetical protein
MEMRDIIPFIGLFLGVAMFILDMLGEHLRELDDFNAVVHDIYPGKYRKLRRILENVFIVTGLLLIFLGILFIVIY